MAGSGCACSLYQPSKSKLGGYIKKYSSVVVLGSVGFDVVETLPGKFEDWILPEKIKQLNVSFTVDSMKRFYGGTGGNCALELGLLGKKPRLVGILGKDGQEYKKDLRNLGVEVKWLKIEKDDFSATGTVITDLNHNQVWSYYPGPLNRMKDIRLKGIVRTNDLVLLMPSTPAAFVTHLKQVVSLGNDFMFDPAFFIPNLTLKDLNLGLDRATIIIGNEYEISLLEAKTKTKLNKWLGGNKVVVVTRGAQGSVIYQDQKVWQIEAIKLKGEINPTGAGDAYRAGLVAGLLEGKAWPICGKKASEVAANKIGRQI